MAYWQYSQLRRLTVRQMEALDERTPGCLECGKQLFRLAMREQWEPWQWLVTGWACLACGALFKEDR